MSNAIENLKQIVICEEIKTEPKEAQAETSTRQSKNRILLSDLRNKAKSFDFNLASLPIANHQFGTDESTQVKSTIRGSKEINIISDLEVTKELSLNELKSSDTFKIDETIKTDFKAKQETFDECLNFSNSFTSHKNQNEGELRHDVEHASQISFNNLLIEEPIEDLNKITFAPKSKPNQSNLKDVNSTTSINRNNYNYNYNISYNYRNPKLNAANPQTTTAASKRVFAGSSKPSAKNSVEHSFEDVTKAGSSLYKGGQTSKAKPTTSITIKNNEIKTVSSIKPKNYVLKPNTGSGVQMKSNKNTSLDKNRSFASSQRSVRSGNSSIKDSKLASAEKSISSSIRMKQQPVSTSSRNNINSSYMKPIPTNASRQGTFRKSTESSRKYNKPEAKSDNSIGDIFKRLSGIER